VTNLKVLPYWKKIKKRGKDKKDKDGPRLRNRLGKPAEIKKYTPREKWISAGGVVMEPGDYTRVWVIKPSNNYGPWSFPKGKVDEGDSLQSAAKREVREETGLKANFVPGGYLGQYEGGWSVTNYYLMIRSGGNPANHDHEVEKVALVTWAEAAKLFARGRNSRDIHVINRALKKVKALIKLKKVGKTR